MRISERDQLARIGRIGEDFLVARHRGVENHLAGGLPDCTNGAALEHRAVLKCKYCQLCHVFISGHKKRERPDVVSWSYSRLEKFGFLAFNAGAWAPFDEVETLSAQILTERLRPV